MDWNDKFKSNRVLHGEVKGALLCNYDTEGHLVSVTGTNLSANFVYNGDGQRVKSVIDSETTLLIGGHYEQKGSQITKYYFAGASRIAMRKYTIPQSMTVEYMLGDHLGSTSITTDNTGAIASEMRYEPWGEIRYSWTANQSTTPAYKLPVYTFTGQRSYMDDPSTSGMEGFGLMDYNARMYDPVTGRFTQADTVVPGGVQGLDRYAYVNNNPLNLIDPSGHLSEKEICRAWDISDCTKENIRSVLGDGLFAILYETDITWGDEIAFGNEDGVTVVGTLLRITYYTNDGADPSTTPALLDVKTGDLIIYGQQSWSNLMSSSSRIAGYNQRQDKWSTWDKNDSSWGNDKAAVAWAGQLRSHYHGDGLFLNDRWVKYAVTYYTESDGWWILTTGGGLVLNIAGIFYPPLWIPGLGLWGFQLGADIGWWSGPIPPREWISAPEVIYSDSWYAEQGLCGHYGIVCP